MGEIIHFDFKNKKVFGKKLPESKPTEEKEVDRKVGGEVGFFAKFMQFVKSGGYKELMHLRVSPTSLHQSRELVKSYETEELIGWLEKTNENDWKKKAAFFQAIFEELKSRLIPK